MQTIVRNSLETLTIRANSNRICRLCSTIESHLFPRPPDVNRVRLIGRVSTEMIPFQDGFLSFLMITTEKIAHIGETPIQSHHTIKAKRGITQPIIPHLEFNDYVLVEGILGSMKMAVKIEELYKPMILAQLIIPFVDTHRTNDPEALVRESTNEVELVGRVINDIHDGDYLSFHLRTYKKLSIDIGPSFMYKYQHKIYVSDPKLMEFVKKNVNPDDYIAIRGSISYTKRETPEGATIRSWISAKSIHKINGPSDLQIIRMVETRRLNIKTKLNQYCILPAATEYP